MRHLGQIGRNNIAADVLAQAYAELRGLLAHDLVIHDLAEADRIVLRIRRFNTDG